MVVLKMQQETFGNIVSITMIGIMNYMKNHIYLIEQFTVGEISINRILLFKIKLGI